MAFGSCPFSAFISLTYTGNVSWHIKYPNLASLLIEVYGLLREADMYGKYNAYGRATIVVLPVLGHPNVKSEGIQMVHADSNFYKILCYRIILL